jgi:hypothetical protein
MGTYLHGWSRNLSRTFVASAHSTRRSASSDSTWHPPTMEGPTSTCALARKAGRCTTGYGRHSPAPKPYSAMGNAERRVSPPCLLGTGPPGVLLLHTRIPTPGYCLLRGRFVGEEKTCTGLDLLVHGHVQGMDRFRPSADVLIARCVVVEIGEFYRHMIAGGADSPQARAGRLRA